MPSDALDPTQARVRFGELIHPATRTYREFEEPGGGIWGPEYFEGKLVRYRLYSEPRAGPVSFADFDLSLGGFPGLGEHSGSAPR